MRVLFHNSQSSPFVLEMIGTIPLEFQPEKCILHRSTIPLTSSGTCDHGFYNTGYFEAFYHRRISQVRGL